MCPGIPNPTIVPESFLDTPLVNGTTYSLRVTANDSYYASPPTIVHFTADLGLGVQPSSAMDSFGPVSVNLGNRNVMKASWMIRG